MATVLQLKRGVTAKVQAYTPLEGELVLDTTTKELRVGDGTTPGGNIPTSGPAVSAYKLTTARAIALAGAVTGTANFDGSAAVSITTTLGNIDLGVL